MDRYYRWPRRGWACVLNVQRREGDQYAILLLENYTIQLACTAFALHQEAARTPYHE